MKRFHLFVSYGYYPEGLDDYKASFETLDEAVAEGERRKTDHNFFDIAETTADGSLRKVY